MLQSLFVPVSHSAAAVAMQPVPFHQQQQQSSIQDDLMLTNAFYTQQQQQLSLPVQFTGPLSQQQQQQQIQELL